jgi:hypothetical protein
MAPTDEVLLEGLDEDLWVKKRTSEIYRELAGERPYNPTGGKDHTIAKHLARLEARVARLEAQGG